MDLRKLFKWTSSSTLGGAIDPEAFGEFPEVRERGTVGREKKREANGQRPEVPHAQDVPVGAHQSGGRSRTGGRRGPSPL